MVDDSTPDCDCEMLALRASVLILPLMREKKDSRSRDDPDARVDGASLFDAPDSAVPRRSRFAISDMRSSESRSVSSSSDDETSSNIATRSFGEIIGSAAFSPTEMARAASTWRTSFGPWVASHSPTDSWSGRSRSAESTGDAAMCWRTSVTRISPSPPSRVASRWLSSARSTSVSGAPAWARPMPSEAPTHLRTRSSRLGLRRSTSDGRFSAPGPCRSKSAMSTWWPEHASE